MINQDETYYDNANILSELTKEAWLLYCSEAGFCAGSVDFWSDLSSDIQRIYIDRILNTNIKIQNMRLITMLEISNNYPDNINIVVTKSSDCEKYTSSLYLMRDGVCHKLLLSFSDFPFDSYDEAIVSMKNKINYAKNYIKENF